VKKDQIEPGMILASKVPGRTNRYYLSPAELLRRGHSAIPAVALAVGRYRVTQQGLCGRAVEISTWESPTNVAVMIPKQEWDNKKQRYLTHADPEVEWVPAVINATSLIPWAEFLRRREEQSLAQMEMEALQARKNEVWAQMEALIKDETLECSKPRLGVYTDEVVLYFEGTVKSPLEGEMKVLYEEYRDLSKKLECAR